MKMTIHEADDDDIEVIKMELPGAEIIDRRGSCLVREFFVNLAWGLVMGAGTLISWIIIGEILRWVQ